MRSSACTGLASVITTIPMTTTPLVRIQRLNEMKGTSLHAALMPRYRKNAINQKLRLRKPLQSIWRRRLITITMPTRISAPSVSRSGRLPSTGLSPSVNVNQRLIGRDAAKNTQSVGIQSANDVVVRRRSMTRSTNMNTRQMPSARKGGIFALPHHPARRRRGGRWRYARAGGVRTRASPDLDVRRLLQAAEPRQESARIEDRVGVGGVLVDDVDDWRRRAFQVRDYLPHDLARERVVEVDDQRVVRKRKCSGIAFDDACVPNADLGDVRGRDRGQLRGELDADDRSESQACRHHQRLALAAADIHERERA